jgi:hypothetical protein
LEELRAGLEPLFPGVREKFDEVKRQLDLLRNHRDEIESADQEELRRVREEISIVGEGVENRRAEMVAKEAEAAELAVQEAELKRAIEECRVKIERAERIKELNRGFEKNEVEGFKGISHDGINVETLKSLKMITGWEISKVDGANVTMVLQDEVVVSFNIEALSRGGSAMVEIPETTDPVHQFTNSAFKTTSLKGDIQSVPRLTKKLTRS